MDNDQLNKINSDIFNKTELVKDFCGYISSLFGFNEGDVRVEIKRYTDLMNANIWAYAEYPYVDKMYRSSYYNYFSTKHKRQGRDCARLSFFSKEIFAEDFRGRDKSKTLQDKFMGFMIIRPTFPNIIGRSVLSPFIFKNIDFKCCTVDIEVMVNGIKLNVKGFPYSSQDLETIKCAETTIWSVMEYFGNKYAEYKPVVPSKIVSTLSKVSHERQLPSSGLTAPQICFALKEYDFGVKLYERETYGKKELRRIFFNYIESGIPFIATLQNKHVAHAVVVIGQENLNYIKNKPFLSGFKVKGLRMVKLFDTADFDRKFVVCDDNYPPYRMAKFDTPTEYYKEKAFQGCKITSIIVPLYPRIYLEAYNTRGLAVSVINEYLISRTIGNSVVFRLFLTSSRSFKNKIALDSDIDLELKEKILETLMPKFIWVAEIIDEKKFFPEQKAFGLIVIDATETSETKAESILFVLYKDEYILFEKEKLIIERVKASSFKIYDNH
jgi:hypothetical protein